VRLALAERWARLRKEEQLGEVLTRVLPRYRGFARPARLSLTPLDDRISGRQ